MGATVAIRMTALYPAQCKGLFLVSLLPPVEVRQTEAHAAGPRAERRTTDKCSSALRQPPEGALFLCSPPPSRFTRSLTPAFLLFLQSPPAGAKSGRRLPRASGPTTPR